MAFYVSSASEYTVSPEVPAATVWDGAWHHVIGSYDGDRVRLWIDGSQVGAGTPTTAAISYTDDSPGVYIGTYRGSCDLGFSGAIDDVAVWDDRPPVATTGPVIAAGRRHADAHRARRQAPAARRPAPPRASPTAACG